MWRFDVRMRGRITFSEGVEAIAAEEAAASAHALAGCRWACRWAGAASQDPRSEPFSSLRMYSWQSMRSQRSNKGARGCYPQMEQALNKRRAS